MIKRLSLLLLVLLSACAPQPVFRDPVAVPDQPMPPTARIQERVVTLLPAGEQTPAPPGPGPTPTRPLDDEALKLAAENLRALTGDPALELTFKGPDHAPNAANFPAYWFEDQWGVSYYVRQDTLQPIEFTAAGPQRPGGPQKSSEALRAMAASLAEARSTRFAALRDRLNYTEGTKGENNFFRWELPGTDVGNMPALLQIGLRSDGTLFSYINSLDFLP